MTDTVDTVIELPVGALAPTPRRRAPAGRAAGRRRQRPAPRRRPPPASSRCRRRPDPVTHRSTNVTRCLDAIERRGHQPTDLEHSQRLTAA